MIVITTPTGDIGHQLLARLVANDEPVRAIARDPARIPAALRDRIETVAGSHGDPEVVDRAFAGADAVFWLAPPNPRASSLEAAYLDFARPARDAIRAHGVAHVVAVSALGRGTAQADRAGFVTASLAMDDRLAESGAAFRALAMPSFMDNLLRQIDAIRGAGAFYGPLDSDRRLPTCATRDIADAAARLLRDRSWTGVGEVPVLGPEDLSPDEMARTISDVLGRPVRYVQTPFDAFEARLREGGMSEAFARGYVEMMRAKNVGLDEGVARTAETASPTSFRTWCEEILRPAVLGPTP